MAHHLHICCPGEQAFPGLRAQVQEFIEHHAEIVLGGGWTVSVTVYDDRGHLDARAHASTVATRPGPTLLLRPIQSRAMGEVTQRLEGRQLVLPADAYDLASLIAAITHLRTQYELGEPLVPLHRAVALMVVGKLFKEHMWAGKNKGYMWSDWIPKGRGVDEVYKPHVAHAVFLLRQHGVLISKISNGKTKLALNPDRRTDIGDILRNRQFSADLERVFARDGRTLPARELNFLDEYDVQEDPWKGD